MLLVTSTGYARTYPMNVLQGNVEAPVPMRFDQPLPGVPISAQGVQGSGQLLLLSQLGRALRVEMRSIRTSGFQAMNCGQEDRVVALELVADGNQQLLLVTADGYGRRFQAEWSPLVARANARGRSMVARRSDVVATTASLVPAIVWLLTSARLIQVDTSSLPLEDSSKTKTLLKLRETETVQSLLSA
jgi:DNA gyrase/topoisomerase IV subunit A